MNSKILKIDPICDFATVGRDGDRNRFESVEVTQLSYICGGAGGGGGFAGGVAAGVVAAQFDRKLHEPDGTNIVRDRVEEHARSSPHGGRVGEFIGRSQTILAATGWNH